ncbi:MAG TPA: peptide chain release factor 2 [Fimbriimonadales bacterium]|nr:peptide chain release factor 2 [Fimbriimonadales bacterium]
MERLRQQINAPDFWENPKQAQAVMRRLSALEGRIEPLEKLRKSLQDITELQALLELSPDPETERSLEEMIRSFLRELDEYELKVLLDDEYDIRNAIVEISAGAGGTEACDWARMLYRMYTRWAERKNYKVEELSMTPGEVTGIRNVTFRVEGPYAYGYLKSEHGVHRLVRISPFDATNRRHTSFALVNVLPEVEETEINLKPEELKIETFRASGAGGQHVNKTESAVRIIHIPTGIVVSCQNERSQHKNRATAMKILAARLAALARNQTEERLHQMRGDLTSAEWGKQIRSYIMQPYALVKDQRTQYETTNVQAVLDGEIDEFIAAYLRKK